MFSDYGHSTSNSNNIGKNINPKTISEKSILTQGKRKGLQNIGSTCYMNATLQALLNQTQFIDALLSYYYKNKGQFENSTNKNDRLVREFVNVAQQVWNIPKNQISHKYITDNLPSFAAYSFQTILEEIGPTIFKKGFASDAKDCFNNLIMNMHISLNKPNNNKNDNDSYVDSRDYNAMFADFMKDFTNSTGSVISDYLYHFNYNVTKCNNCNTHLYNFQTDFFRVFPLEEVRKFRIYITQNSNYDMNKVPLTIFDCLDYDRRYELMHGANVIYCNYCKQQCPATRTTKLFSPSKIFTIILNYGKGLQFDVPLQIQEKIDLRNYFSEEFQNQSKYFLSGIVCHLGESGQSGHFIAFTRTSPDTPWIRYNDALVDTEKENTQVKEQMAKMLNGTTKNHPYLLFYTQLEDQTQQGLPTSNDNVFCTSFYNAPYDYKLSSLENKKWYYHMNNLNINNNMSKVNYNSTNNNQKPHNMPMMNNNWMYNNMSNYNNMMYQFNNQMNWNNNQMNMQQQNMNYQMNWSNNNQFNNPMNWNNNQTNMQQQNNMNSQRTWGNNWNNNNWK